MTCLWNGLRNGFALPFIAFNRLWRQARRTRINILDPQQLSPHWRRDLGLDN